MPNYHGYKFSGCNSIYLYSLVAHMLHLIAHCSLITVHHSFDSIPLYKKYTLQKMWKMLIDRMNIVSIVLEVIKYNWYGGRKEKRWIIARPLHLIDNQIWRWHHHDLRFHDLNGLRVVEIIEAQCMIETCTNILEDKLKHSLNAMVFVLEFQHQSKIHIIFKQNNDSKQTSRQTQKPLKETTLRLWNDHPNVMVSSLSNIDLE